MTKLELFNKTQLKKELPDIRPGDTVQVYQKIPAPITKKSVVAEKEKDKERIQVFEGVVLARKHRRGVTATITVRKVISGIGVERIFPLHSPNIEKIKILKRGKARRAKLYYLRKAKGRKAKLKKVELTKRIGSSDKSQVKKERAIGEKKEVKENKKEK